MFMLLNKISHVVIDISPVVTIVDLQFMKFFTLKILKQNFKAEHSNSYKDLLQFTLCNLK